MNNSLPTEEQLQNLVKVVKERSLKENQGVREQDFDGVLIHPEGYSNIETVAGVFSYTCGSEFEEKNVYFKLEDLKAPEPKVKVEDSGRDKVFTPVFELMKSGLVKVTLSIEGKTLVAMVKPFQLLKEFGKFLQDSSLKLIHGEFQEIQSHPCRDCEGPTCENFMKGKGKA